MDPSLLQRLCDDLPLEARFDAHHLSTPPTQCQPLYAPRPGAKPQKTYKESHFLMLTIPESIKSNHHDIPIFAIEVLVYSTSTLTTLFVSKADSTGYVSLLQLSKGHTSILKSATAAFVSHLVYTRQRSDRRLVVSLFARAQATYLFPGSPESGHKHILDDRQLVKWWCRTLDPVMRDYGRKKEGDNVDEHDHRLFSKAYLIVPGHDKHETAAFYPPTARHDTPGRKRWVNECPMRHILPDPTAPPRSLIPHFPDDPKARYLDELDDEIPDVPSSQVSVTDSPSKRGAGCWQSVKTLEQFWEMMAHRQECSSGRLVGFMWIIFNPGKLQSFSSPEQQASPSRHQIRAVSKSPHTPTQSNTRTNQKPKARLTGVIIPRKPRVKSAASISESSHGERETTAHYHVPASSCGRLVLSAASYDRALRLLLRLDFANLIVAQGSTAKWVKETAVIAGKPGFDWQMRIEGERPAIQEDQTLGKTVVIGQIPMGKRKREEKDKAKEEESGSHLLTDGLVRKKPKPEGHPPVPTAGCGHNSCPVNVLGGSSIRKKGKA